MPRRIRLVIAVSAITLVALTACAPTPEPEPEPAVTSESPSPSPSVSEAPVAPTIDELVVTPDGMGTLVIGQAPPTDPAQRMIEEDPAACADINTGWENGFEPGDPESLRWVPIDAYETGGFAPWSVNVLDGLLDRIDVRDASIPTDKGVRIGDSRAAALAAYPDAPVSDQDITQVIVVPGEHGVLHIEIASGAGAFADYWGDVVDTVVFIRVVTLDSGVFTVAASENIAGGCL